MTFESAQHIFEAIRHFHEDVAQFYREQAERMTTERLAILFRYLAEEETAVARRIELFEQQASERILNTEYQFVPPKGVWDGVLSAPIATNPDLDEVAASVRRIDETISELYDQMARDSDLPDISEFFVSLQDEQNQRRDRHIQAIEETGDI